MKVQKRSSLTKKAQNDVIYDAVVLSKVTIDENDIQYTDDFIALKNSDISLDEKIEKAKEMLNEIAYTKLSDDVVIGTRLTDNSIQSIDMKEDRLDWVSLFEEEEV